MKDKQNLEVLKLEFEHSRTFATTFLGLAVSFLVPLWLAQDAGKSELVWVFGILAIIMGVCVVGFIVAMEKDYRLIKNKLTKEK